MGRKQGTKKNSMIRNQHESVFLLWTIRLFRLSTPPFTIVFNRKTSKKNFFSVLRRHLRGILSNATINSNCSINFICRALFRLFYIMLEFLLLTFFVSVKRGQSEWLYGSLDGDNCEWLEVFWIYWGSWWLIWFLLEECLVNFMIL